MPSIADFCHPYNVRAFENLDPPAMKAPVVEGTPGSQELTYAATFVTICGETIAGTPVSISNGPDTLNGFDKVKLGVEAVPAAARYVRFYKNTGEGLRLLGEVAASLAQLYDTGQDVSSIEPPSANTSGRPQHLAIGYHPGELGQRQDWMDMQAIYGRGLKGLGDTIFRDGDVVSGCQPQSVGTNQYQFTDGYVYLYGMIHSVDASDTITLTGSGKEVVGLRVEEQWVTPTEDPILKAHADENVPAIYAQMGADRLVLNLTWVVDEPGQINVRPFLDGEPLLEQRPTERSELVEMIERRSHDVSGSFSVKPFPRKMLAHLTDEEKLTLRIMGGGKAYVGGREIATIAPQDVDIPKGRDTMSRNNAALDPYDAPGGVVIGTASESFDVDGLAVKLRIGQGNYHTVGLTGNGQTAQQVANQIASSVNAYPTSGTLVSCTDASGKLRIQGADGKDLTIAAVASDAYTVLGLTTGTYKPSGQRIYKINDAFVKTVSDFSYITEIVEAVTHDGTDHIDLLANANVVDIVGASDVEADAHDGKYDYIKNVDFVKNGNQIDFAALGGNDPANGQTYYVRYKYTHNAVKGTRVRVRMIDAQIIKGAEDGQDTILFTGATSATEVQSGNPVSGLSGEASDVISILRVNNSPGQSQSEYSSYALLKNSDALEHESSQIDWSAAGAQGESPGGQPVTSATYYCSFEFWYHAVEGDYVAADSYVNDYEEIEQAPNGIWELRDCADFRTAGGVRPVQSDSPRFDYEFYLSRIDRIVLTKEGYFQRIAGVPALESVAPKAQDGPLSIYLLSVPPYTYKPSDVLIQSVEMQRITQQGLNELRAQIERLQYYNALYLSERTAVENTAATDAKGVFVDNLIGQKNGDFAFNKNGVQFTAAIDSMERCLRLPVTEDGREITLNDALSTGFARVGKVLMFAHQPYAYLTQPKGTGVINVNPHAVYGWIGTLELDPEEDFWTDVNRLPDLDVNYDDQMAAIAQIEEENAIRARQITWGAWRLLWDNSGGWAQQNMPSGQNWTNPGAANYDWALAQYGFNAQRERVGTYKSIVPERTLVDDGDRIVDETIIPYMRQIEVNCIAKGLMPNIDVAVSIDGVVIDFLPTGTTQAGTLTYQNKSTITTSAAGAATGKFTIPEDIPVGSKAVKVFSAADPGETYALSLFASQGFRQTVQHQWMGIITTTERDETAVQTQWHYGDPLAQTFAITSGIRWISYVDLYFQSKDANLPVTVEMRQTLSGSPTRTVLQTCTLDPDDVNVSDDASIATRFQFQNIVGYTPGEYCFVMIANCQSYHVWYAQMGQTDVVSGELVRQQPTDGVMFTSPNNSYWEGHAEWDLMFEIGCANFESNCQLVWDDITGCEASMLIVAATQMLPESCDLHWMYSLDDGGTWIPFVAGIDRELGEIATTVKLRCDITGSGGTFQISESGAGIILLLNEPSAWYVGHNGELAESSDAVRMVVQLAVDGTNGSGTRSATPYYSIDDGDTLVELKPKQGYTPVAIGDGTYKEFEFETPGEATITDASNTTPIVITSAGHGHQDDSVVDITGVGGNTAANGTWRIQDATTDTFAIVNPDTGADSVGNGAYTSGGTVKLAEYTQLRTFLLLETDNRAVTPKAREVRCFAA